MLEGVWIPLVTPFKDGCIDLPSFRRLVEHYVRQNIAGLVLLGTTGEAPTLDEAETDELVAVAVEVTNRRLPIFVGIGGNDTREVVKAVERLARFEFAGILSVCPYYSRPPQEGMIGHFSAIADATDRRILIYNIPYRTSVNLSNDGVFRLAERQNIIGIKDSSGDIGQSLDLLARRPPDFSVLTGEDALYFTMRCNGAEGGILAAAHLETEEFVEVGRLIAANDHRSALQRWRPLHDLVKKLFQETNPIAIKHCLWRQGMIASPECRLPLSPISEALARELERSCAFDLRDPSH